MSRRQPLPRTPDHVRAEAVNLAAEVGAKEAAERLGLNASTVRTWLNRRDSAVRSATTVVARAIEADPVALDESQAPESTAVTLADRGKPWVGRAQALAIASYDTATEALAAARLAIAAGRHRQAKDLAVTYGVLIDKAFLIDGRPTRVTEEHSTSTSVHIEHRRITVETDAELARQVAQLRRELGLAAAEPIDAEVVDDDA